MERSPAIRGAGFTLLEMLVVVAIMGLVLSLIVLRGPMRNPALSVRAAAGDVAQALRAARAQAIAEGRPVALLLDAARHRYVTTGVPPRVMPAPPSVVVTMPVNGISFAPDGSSSGGDIAVAAEGHAAQVVVSWLTGRVSVAEAR
jgi:general secretion pathway protein H